MHDKADNVKIRSEATQQSAMSSIINDSNDSINENKEGGKEHINKTGTNNIYKLIALLNVNMLLFTNWIAK